MLICLISNGSGNYSVYIVELERISLALCFTPMYFIRFPMKLYTHIYVYSYNTYIYIYIYIYIYVYICIYVYNYVNIINEVNL